MVSVFFVDAVSINNGQARVSLQVLKVLRSKYGKVTVFDVNPLASQRLFIRLVSRLACLLKFIFCLFSLRSSLLVYLVLSRSTFTHIFDLVFFLAVKLYFYLNPSIGTTLVCHLHGSDFDSMMENYPLFYRQFLLRLLGSIPAHIVCLSHGHSRYFFSGRYSHSHVVENFSDFNLHLPAIEDGFRLKNLRSKALNRQYVFTHASVPRYDKGLICLIDQLVLYCRNRNTPPDFTVKINILGWEYSDLRKILDLFQSSYDFDGFNRLVGQGILTLECFGWVDGSCKWSLYSQSDALFLLSSYKSESVPLVVLEAASIGLPAFVSSYKLLPDLACKYSSVSVFTSMDAVFASLESRALVDALTYENSLTVDKFNSRISSLFDELL